MKNVAAAVLRGNPPSFEIMEVGADTSVSKWVPTTQVEPLLRDLVANCGFRIYAVGLL